MAEQIYSLHFLREFTKALIFNFIPPQELEKLKQTEPVLIKETQAEESIKLIPSYQSAKESQTNRYLIQRTKTNPPIYIRNQGFSRQQAVYLDLGKIQSLIDDNSVASVDCPGPGKIISARKMNSVVHTNIMLSQEEINNIINFFSQQARIPRIGGFFKAVVNNLMINAVDSDFGGPRFMITKVTRPIMIPRNF